MIVISGDIGGTKTRMQLTEFATSGEMEVIASVHYSNSNFYSFLDIIDAFFTETKTDVAKIASACFGVAGPVIKGIVDVTNLPWVISADEIKDKLKLDKVELINDFTAIGYGLEVLESKDLSTLQAGNPRENYLKAYIGAGTGLGIGFVSCHNGEYFAHSTEGGHVDFAPVDSVQIELLKYLRKKHHRVSFERVLSGQGLVNIYSFVRDNGNFAENEDKDIDNVAKIVEHATKNQDKAAAQALDLFIRIYGAAVGNLALTTLPFGGLYIVGGIAPKLLEQLKDGRFLEAYSDKGRMSNLIKNIPLHVVLNEDVGLQGTALYAKKIV